MNRSTWFRWMFVAALAIAVAHTAGCAGGGTVGPGGENENGGANVNDNTDGPESPVDDSDDDRDGDGWTDERDNCPDTADTDQTDTDGDEVGDVCDNCPDDSNPDQSDRSSSSIQYGSGACGSTCRAIISSGALVGILMTTIWRHWWWWTTRSCSAGWRATMTSR